MLRCFSVIRKHSIITLPKRPKVMRTPYSDRAQMLMSGWQLLQILSLLSHPSDTPDLQLSVHEVSPFYKSESLGVIVIKPPQI